MKVLLTKMLSVWFALPCQRRARLFALDATVTLRYGNDIDCSLSLVTAKYCAKTWGSSSGCSMTDEP